MHITKKMSFIFRPFDKRSSIVKKVFDYKLFCFQLILACYSIKYVLQFCCLHHKDVSESSMLVNIVYKKVGFLLVALKFQNCIKVNIFRQLSLDESQVCISMLMSSFHYTS